MILEAQMTNDSKPDRQTPTGHPDRRPKDHKLRERWLSDQLRRMYDETVEEPIPDDLQNLLQQLDETDGDGKRDRNER